MTITYEETKAELERIVETQGADTVARCMYRDSATSEPVCIVGHLVNNLLGESALMDLFEGNPVRGMLSIFYRYGFDDKAVELLDAVQQVQDNYYTWETAVRIGTEAVQSGAYATDNFDTATGTFSQW